MKLTEAQAKWISDRITVRGGQVWLCGDTRYMVLCKGASDAGVGYDPETDTNWLTYGTAQGLDSLPYEAVLDFDSPQAVPALAELARKLFGIPLLYAQPVPPSGWNDDSPFHWRIYDPKTGKWYGRGATEGEAWLSAVINKMEEECSVSNPS